MQRKLTKAVVRKLLDYDPETGAMIWKRRERELFRTNNAYKTWNTRFAGKSAFTTEMEIGYHSGTIFGEHVYKHRIIFLWMTGRMPEQVDHDDGDKTNNRWVNLKAADNRTNRKNMPLRADNKAGHVGISFDKATKKWNAFINAENGKTKRLGRFATMEEAVAVRQAASFVYSYSPNHGRN